MALLTKLDTPCIGICSTVYGDDVCRGCKRTSQEVIDWNGYDDQTKQYIFARLEQLQVRAMQDKITVIDVDKLRAALEIYHIRFRTESDPLCWAYHLLRVRMEKITAPAEVGFEIHSVFKNYSMRQLFTLIDAEILQSAT